jgi:hypothetical protein
VLRFQVSIKNTRPTLLKAVFLMERKRPTLATKLPKKLNRMFEMTWGLPNIISFELLPNIIKLPRSSLDIVNQLVILMY